MKPSRTALALVMLLTLVVSLPVVGSAQSELEDARRRAAEAEAEQRRAQTGAEAAESARMDLAGRVDAALAAYQDANAELESLGLSLAGLRHQIDVTEDEVATLREIAHEQAAQAYMRTIGGGSPVFLSSSFEEMAVMSESIGRASDDNLLTYEILETRRAELTELRLGYQDEKERMAVLNDKLSEKLVELEALFSEADSRMLDAFRNLAEVDAAYAVAQAALAEAQRKYRWTGSVEQWRPLVEQYFPPERVQEAMRVMACESGGNPNAKNPTSTATGLFQFLTGTWAWSSVSAGWSGYSRLDPEANIAVAAWLVDRSVRTNHPGGAWGHWECQP